MIRPHARLAVAAASVALAVWLLPASVHIASWPASGPARIAYLAPLTRLWIALAIAAAVAAPAASAWQRSGRTGESLSRALAPLALLLLWAVPYLPWLPDRAPLLLVLAGPLRWLVAATSIFGVATAAVPGGPRKDLAARWFGRRTLFAVSFAVYVALGVRFATEVGFGGDEPHYLIITHSLLADRDLDIANNHAQRDYRAFFPGVLRPDYLQRGRRGEIYSIHAPGLPALLLPAYAIAGAVGAVVFIAFLGALTALAMFDLAALVAGAAAARTAWVALSLTVPFVPHAWLIYPELPGALIVAWGALWLWQPPVSIARTALHGAALALLPWLHTKFVVFLALLGLFEAIRLYPRFRHIVALAAPMALSGVAWLLSFYWMYGVFDPEAPYGAYTRMFVLAKNIPRGALGLLFDQKFGLLAFSPVYVLAGIGSWLILRERAHRWRGAGMLVTAAIFFISTTRLYMWWGGSSPPARFLVPVVPLTAPMLAVAVARLNGVLGRAVVTATLLASVAIATVAVVSPGEELVYSTPHGVSSLARAMQGGAPLTESLPTFTEEDWRAPAARLWPWLLAVAGSAALLAMGARVRLVRTPFGAAVLGGSALLLIAGLGARVDTAAARTAVAVRGQLGLMDRYDPARLRTVNLSTLTRLSDADTLAAAMLTVRHRPGAEIGDPRMLDGPFDLPEGRYVARLWFEGQRAPHGEVHVGLAETVYLAHAAAPLDNPSVLPFDLPVSAPTFMGVGDPNTAQAVRRVDIAPTFLVPRSQRAVAPAHVVEPVEGGSGLAYVAYTDENAYPEGGVFWTRGTERSRVLIAPAGATMLRLIVHVGPGGATVQIAAGESRFDVEMQPDETRDVDIPLAPALRRLELTVRASRSFVPAEVGAGSDDTRSLGCQVRPVLSSAPARAK